MAHEETFEDIDAVFKTLNIDVLHKVRYPEKEKRILDYVVKGGNDIALVKTATRVSTGSSIFKELKRLANLVELSAVFIAEKLNNEDVVEGVIHMRERVGVIGYKTLRAIAHGEKVYVYEFKGMYYVKIDGKKLRNLRLKKGYRFSDLARAVGTSVKALQKYEEGVIDMSVEKACRFMEVFGDDFSQVLVEVDIFRDRIPEHTRSSLPPYRERMEHRCKMIEELTGRCKEFEVFSHFTSDIVFSSENDRLFISLIDERLSYDEVLLKAIENRQVSRVLRGTPVNVVSDTVPRYIIAELEDYAPVYRCNDVAGDLVSKG